MKLPFVVILWSPLGETVRLGEHTAGKLTNQTYSVLLYLICVIPILEFFEETASPMIQHVRGSCESIEADDLPCETEDYGEYTWDIAIDSHDPRTC